jgi:gluconolactonase
MTDKKTLLVILSWVSAPTLLLSLAFTQAPAVRAQGGGGAAAAPVCRPPAGQEGGGGPARGAGAAAGAAAPARAPAPTPAPRDLTIKEIPGVVGAGGSWTKIWQQAGNSADGILMDKDGSMLVAQEDYDTVLKIDPDGHSSAFVSDAKGLGSLSMDRQGRLWGAHRTERPGSTKPDKDTIENAISILAPAKDRKVIADKWADDGAKLNVRPNDLLADSKGGAYFTVGCLYYANEKGVTIVADNLRTNGIAFSPDDKVLYVTNGGSLVAFDVKGPGMLENRRDFAMLPQGAGGDGMAVDTEGRLYVSSGPGVQVVDKTGKWLGVIPTPRGVITTGFGGPDKKTLFIACGGADDANGQPIRQGPQNTAATVYKLTVLAQGVKGRSK